MEAQRIEFLLIIQARVDSIEKQLGKDHPKVYEIKQKFQKLLDRDIVSPKRELEVPDTSKVAKLITEVQRIREHLDLRADPSIDYARIPSGRVKRQLLKDNLRMENIRLDSSIKDEDERFYSFCLNAFYQIEELINFYYSKKYSLAQLIQILKKDNQKYDYSNCDSLIKIPIYQKTFIFEKSFLFDRYNENGQRIKYDYILGSIRKIRNESSHRYSELVKDTKLIKIEKQKLLEKIRKSPKPYVKSQTDKRIENEAHLIDFISEKPYDRIRGILIDIYGAIVRDLATG